MAWKPCRGNNILFDKAIKNSHECYFEFCEANSIKTKTKIALKWLRAEQYLGNEKRLLTFFGTDFIEECKNNTETYKPFLKALTQLHN